MLDPMPTATNRSRISALVPWLIRASSIAWLVSLTLPGFVVNPSPEPWFGARILGYGLAFGWLCNGWAVYANIFFIYGLARLLLGAASVPAAIAAIGLAATLPLFTDLPHGSSGASLPVLGWGSGVAFWLAALLLLFVATLLRSSSSNLAKAGGAP